MRPQKVLDEEILAGLTKVFRSKGYEGASLKELAEATGLKKASLYHRFPNGKQEMAQAVINHLDIWVEQYVFKVLLDETQAPEERLRNGLTQINKLYNGGASVCIFRALSMEVTSKDISPQSRGLALLVSIGRMRDLFGKTNAP